MVAIIKVLFSATLLASASAAAIKRTDAGLMRPIGGFLGQVSDPVLAVDSDNSDNTDSTDNTDDSSSDDVTKRTIPGLLQPIGDLLGEVSDPVLAGDSDNSDNTDSTDDNSNDLTERSTGGVSGTSSAGMVEVDDPVLQPAHATTTKRSTTTTTTTTTTKVHITRATAPAAPNVALPASIQASSVYGVLTVGDPVLGNSVDALALAHS